MLNSLDDSPFHDVRVRRAINYAIDREGLCKLINGTAKPAVGLYPPGHPFFGSPTQHYTYDPAKAKALLKEAGYGPDKPLKAKIMISTSGSGQMLPIPMNEFMQQNFKDVGMRHRLRRRRVGHHAGGDAQPSDRTAGARRRWHQHQPELGRSLDDVPLLLQRQLLADQFQLGPLQRPAFGQAVDAVRRRRSIRSEQTKMLAEAHSVVVDQAAWLFIVHDLNPRAMSKKVLDFRPAQSWFQDFTQISMA